MKNKHEPSSQEKYFISEQPGFSIVFVGLAVALIVGLSFRAYFSPNRVRELVIKASTRVHKDFKFELESAEVSLAHGMLPRLAVVIHNVKIEALTKCYLSPLAEINELELPVSFSSLLQGRFSIREIRADYVNLIMRSKPEDCEKNKGVQVEAKENSASDSVPQELAKVAEVNPQVSQAVAKAYAENKISEKRVQQAVETLNINKLRVSYLPKAYMSAEIQNFKGHLKSIDPKIITLEGRVNLGGDSIAGEYSSRANFYAEYSEVVSPTWKTQVNGNWREGHYDLYFNHRVDTLDTEISAELKHIPLSQVLILAKKYDVIHQDLNGEQIWFSAKLSSKGKIGGSLKQAPVEVSDVVMEGDVGELKVAKVNIPSIEPFRYDPLIVEINKLSVKKLLSFLNREHPTPALGELGVFNGTLELYSSDHAILRGEHAGLQLVFSNKGERAYETISLIKGELKLAGDKWNLALQTLRPEAGVFSGDMHLQASSDWRDVKIKADLREFSLSPKVQSLMTDGGSVGAIAGQLEFQLKQGSLESLSGDIRNEGLQLDGFDIEKSKFHFETKSDVVFVSTEIHQMSLDKDAVVSPYLMPMLSLLSDSQGRYKFKNISTKIQTAKLKDFKWTHLNAQSNNQVITSDGGWDTAGTLSGFLNVRTATGTKKIELKGDRSNPKLISQGK